MISINKIDDLDLCENKMKEHIYIHIHIYMAINTMIQQTQILLNEWNIIDCKTKAARMVVAVFMRRDVAAMLTCDKMNTKGGWRAFYHKSLDRQKTLSLTLGDESSWSLWPQGG